MKGKAAIVGDGDGILVFKAAGVDAYPAADVKEAKDILRGIAKEYAVIFVTEGLYAELGGFLRRFDEGAYPAVLAVPDGKGKGYAMEEIRRASETALGVDILFNDRS